MNKITVSCWYYYT